MMTLEQIQALDTAWVLANIREPLFIADKLFPPDTAEAHKQ